MGWVKASFRRPGPRTAPVPARRDWPGRRAVVRSQGPPDCGPPPYPAVTRARKGGGGGGGGSWTPKIQKFVVNISFCKFHFFAL